MKRQRRKARILAFQAVYSYQFSSYSGLKEQKKIADLLNFNWLESEEAAAIQSETFDFARLLCIGVLETLPEIDRMIKKNLLNWDFNRLLKVDLAVLRVSTYSLIYQPDIDYQVIINEAIEIIKEYGSSEKSYRFVNGILDAIYHDLNGQLKT